MSNKADKEKKLPEGPLPSAAPAPAPEVKVEAPGLDDKKEDFKQEQKKQQQQPQDTGRNLMNTSTWIEFFAELMKYFRENSAKKPQQQESKTAQNAEGKLPNQPWKRAAEPSQGAKEMRDSAAAPKMGGHRKGPGTEAKSVSNETFLNENLKDAGLTNPQIKGVAGMLDKQGVNLKEVSEQKGSQSSKSADAGSQGNKAFIQDASNQLGLNLPDKAVNAIAGLADKLGVNLSSMMNNAMNKGAEAAKGAQAGAGGGVNPRIQALKSAQSERQRSATVGQPTAAASSSKKEEVTRPRSESVGGMSKK